MPQRRLASPIRTAVVLAVVAVLVSWTPRFGSNVLATDRIDGGPTSYGTRNNGENYKWRAIISYGHGGPDVWETLGDQGTDGTWPITRMRTQAWRFRRTNCGAWETRGYGSGDTPDVAWYNYKYASGWDYDPLGACLKRRSYAELTYWDDGRTQSDPFSYWQSKTTDS